VRDGDALRVITDAGSGKAKRLRNNGDVLVAPCDMRGRLKGEAVPARAVLEDAAETARTRDLVAKRYGLLGRWMLRKGNDARVGIRITAG
jgi:PPOX class probable F420-dependent enzyme